MISSTPNGFWLASLLLVIASGFGCASPNVNPPTPRAHTAYVDFYTASAGGLAWDVQRFDAALRYRTLFSKLDPIPDGVLRLALPPGGHRLRITFLNRAVSEPAVIDVDASGGQVTPVEVELIATGTASVRTQSRRPGATYRGGYGRVTKIGSDEIQTYRVTAAAQPFQPYQLKEQMPYACGLAK